MPDLTGMTLSQATEQLETKHLELGTVSTIESAPKGKDRVVVQRPSSQTQVEQNSPVNLEIGTGIKE